MLAGIIIASVLVYIFGTCWTVGYLEGRYNDPNWEPGFWTAMAVFFWPITLGALTIFRICGPIYDFGRSMGSKKRNEIESKKRIAIEEMKNQKEQENLLKELEESKWNELERAG